MLTVLLFFFFFFFFRGDDNTKDRDAVDLTTKELSLSLSLPVRLEIGADDAPAAPLQRGTPETGTLNNKNFLNPKHGTFLFFPLVFFLFFFFPENTDKKLGRETI